MGHVSLTLPGATAPACVYERANNEDVGLWFTENGEVLLHGKMTPGLDCRLFICDLTWEGNEARIIDSYGLDCSHDGNHTMTIRRCIGQNGLYSQAVYACLESGTTIVFSPSSFQQEEFPGIKSVTYTIRFDIEDIREEEVTAVRAGQHPSGSGRPDKRPADDSERTQRDPRNDRRKRPRPG